MQIHPYTKKLVTQHPHDHCHCKTFRSKPSPLTRPFSTKTTISTLTSQILSNQSIQSSLHSLLHQNARNVHNVSSLQQHIHRHHQSLRHRNHLSKALRQIHRLLSRTLSTRHRTLFPSPSSSTQFHRTVLSTLPPSATQTIHRLDRCS